MPPSSGSSSSSHLQYSPGRLQKGKSSSQFGPRRSNGPPIPPSQLSTRGTSGKRARSPAPKGNNSSKHRKPGPQGRRSQPRQAGASPRNSRLAAQDTPAPPPTVGLPENSFAKPAEALEKVAARTLGIPVASARAKGLAKKMASSLVETMTPRAPDPPLAPRVSVASQIAGLPGNPVNNSRV